MESEILKFICANQGAVNTEYLVCNLGDEATVSEIISNREKFVPCCPFGQPRVVARTSLRLCRAKDCQGSCRGLHLCKTFLFCGSCPFSQTRRGCSFSHDLSSDHNQRILGEHELESLSRTELSTLLLQSDDRLLPSICHDYNNGNGEFGLCPSGYGCRRLHICERFLNCECRCPRSHDFNDPQPLNVLHGLPEDLFCSLKSVYSNIQALKYYDNQARRGNKGYRGNRGNRGFRANRGNHLQQEQTYLTSNRYVDDGLNEGTSDGSASGQNRSMYARNPNKSAMAARGRGGSRGNHQSSQQSSSLTDIRTAFSVLELMNFDGPSNSSLKGDQLMSCSSEVSSVCSDSDAGSTDSQGRKPSWGPNKSSPAVRGRGGKRGGRGNHQQVQQTRTNVLSGAVSTDNGPDRQEPRRPARDKTEICMYFIKGHCKHEERCYKAHDKMPYRWEVKEGDQWTAMPDNETVEKDYCDPKNTYSSSSSPVHFDTMTCGANKVRRLSTMNSLLEPTFIHTTEWVWYWEDECGEWNMYASADGGHKAADIDSSKLEQKFLDNPQDVVEFNAGLQSYSLCFQDMIQTNKKYGTKRVVRRRPRFFSAADVQTRRVRRPLTQESFAAVPDCWDKKQIPQTGYKRVALQSSSSEFKEIETLFLKTMRGFDIVKIERIQNKELWEAFHLQKRHMKNNNGGRDVTEKKLFHGTDNKYVDVICHTNFDWRVCGVNGTAFGKGSYFAQDAKYSHSYTSDTDVKSMFIARVLVGEYAKGSNDFRRPPSKDGGDINFFDSCVDNVLKPSIYVVFEKHQIYPEYLLQYQDQTVKSYGALYKSGTSSYLSSVSLFPTSASMYQPSTSSYRPSTSSSQPSMSSYQPSTSSSQTSTSSYRPSTSSSQTSTSSYRPSTSSSQTSTPSYRPSTSSSQTSTSSYRPSTSSSQTSTPSYQPSTSSYHSSTPSYQPSQPNKKPDSSCVIA